MDWELHPVAEFINWSEPWQTLNKKLTNNLPVLDSTFILPLINCFSNNEELLVIGKINNVVVAMGIFQKKNFFSWRIFQPSQAPVGLWLCSEENIIIALDSLIKKLPGFILKLDIIHQDPNICPPIVTDQIENIDYIYTSKLTIDQDFNSYFQSLGKNQRQNYNKANNRLIKQDINVKLEIVTNSQKMHQCVEQYGVIESNSWKDAMGTSIKINNQQGKFYSAMLSAFAKEKNAQVWKYFYNDKIVAIDLCIKNNEQLIILKTTFDSNYSRFSPAINMKLDALKQIFDKKILHRIEFFGKTRQWHTRLNSIGRTMYHFSFYRYSPLLKIKKILFQLLRK